MRNVAIYFVTAWIAFELGHWAAAIQQGHHGWLRLGLVEARAA